MQMAPTIASSLNLETALVGSALSVALAALADKQAKSRPALTLKLSHQCRYIGRNDLNVTEVMQLSGVVCI